MWRRRGTADQERAPARLRFTRAQGRIAGAVLAVLAVAAVTTLAHGDSTNPTTLRVSAAVPAATGAAAGRPHPPSTPAAPGASSAAPDGQTSEETAQRLARTATGTPGSPSAAPSASDTAPSTVTSSGAAVKSLAEAVDTAQGSVSVTVTDLSTGATLDYGATGHSFATASIVKVDILASLLLQAQGRGTTLTATQRAVATRMIENSDNDAASSLYQEIGENSGLDAANKRFGLTSTHGGSGLLWGVTTTTAADQLRLLRQVFTDSSLLDAASRSYLQGLMVRVESDQSWGVSAAATAGGFALKNGWLPRTATGLWVVNSIGRIDYDGHGLLVSVLSDGNPTMDEGVTLVEAVARAAVAALPRS